MPLARDFESGEVDNVDLGTPQSIVIAIAASVEERARLGALVGGAVGVGAPVFVVESRAEAVALLLAAEAVGARATATHLPVLDMGPPAAVVLEAVPASLEVDSEWRVASWEGRTVPLSPLEHDLLTCLLQDRHATWPFELLHQQVWGNDHQGDRSDVHAVVKRLRRKLLVLDSPVTIHTFRGVGLRLVDSRQGRPAPTDARL